MDRALPERNENETVIDSELANQGIIDDVVDRLRGVFAE